MKKMMKFLDEFTNDKFPPTIKHGDEVSFRFHEGNIEYNFRITIEREEKEDVSKIWEQHHAHTPTCLHT